MVIVGLAVSIPLIMAANSGHRIEGVVNLFSVDGIEDPIVTGDWDSCEGLGGYSDISPGMPLTITDQNGTIVGSGSVTNFDDATLQIWYERDSGFWDGVESVEDARTNLVAFAASGVGCSLHFTATVKNADFYSLEFARRGALSYSTAELGQMGWWVSLSLGD